VITALNPDEHHVRAANASGELKAEGGVCVCVCVCSLRSTSEHTHSIPPVCRSLSHHDPLRECGTEALLRIILCR